MQLCYITKVDEAGRIYIPKDILAVTKLKQGDVLYIKADDKTGSIVIATEDYFNSVEC